MVNDKTNFKKTPFKSLEMRAWGDHLVCKHCPPKQEAVMDPCKMSAVVSCTCNPSAQRLSQVDPWGSLVSQLV